MTTNANKMDSAEVYNLFETIKELLIKQKEKQTQKQDEVVKVDNTLSEKLDIVIEEVMKPKIVEHNYAHKINIGIHSNWFFFSWVVLVFIIFGLFWNMLNQRETINQLKENDLKYRYIRMIGQSNDENLYRLEQQFKFGDSIKIVRKQVEKYEELVRERAERIERARRNSEEMEKIQEKTKRLKNIN